MRKIKYKAWSECCQDFLNITGFECTDGEITGIFHDGDFIGYDKEDIDLLEYTGLRDDRGERNIHRIYSRNTEYKRN